MKQEDFERLKAKLGDEFEIIQDALVSIDGTIAFVRKKDIWDGVEFARYKFPHHLQFPFFKVKETKGEYLIPENGGELFKGNCEPITEQAYIEQLKKEAHERFGEIKEGDTFNGFIRSCNKGMDNWYYSRDKDALFAFGARIYKQGKWATRVKERVKVELIHETLSNNPTYQFKLTNWNETNRAKYSGQFLASQLEKYLNGKIE